MTSYPSLYDYATEAEFLLQDFLHAERCAKTVSLLMAQGVLPIKRQKQHAMLHMTFASLLVQAYEDGGEFEAKFSSTAYNSRHNVPSATHFMLKLMVAQGLLEEIGVKTYKITEALEQAVGPIELNEAINA